MKRISLLVVAAWALLSQPMGAQERLGSGAPEPQYRGGWTFTPIIGVSETYDTNVALFSEGHPGTDDTVRTVFPGADLHYLGKHTMLDTSYSGSYLDYNQFSALNRWDQRGRFEVRRQESARLTWSGIVSAAALPSTDLIDLGGIPYRSTGATTVDGRGAVEYSLAAHNTITSSVSYQSVTFDRPEVEIDILRGGRIFESMNTWRHKFSERVAIGADYSFRRALVTGDVEPFDFHTAEAALDYELSPLWSLQGGAGVVYLQKTLLTEAHAGPAWRVALQRSHAGTTFHVGYLRTFIPSFGYGGTVESQDVGAGFRTPLFHSRRFYLDGSAVFRDNQPLTGVAAIADPLTGALQQLPLRSLRTNVILGWEPQPWVRIEAFYSLVQQTSLQVGGYIDRNRVGFQIVTSKPMRMQ